MTWALKSYKPKETGTGMGKPYLGTMGEALTLSLLFSLSRKPKTRLQMSQVSLS